MTRKEGIIKRSTDPKNTKILMAAKNLDALIDTEYKNYTELCHYCYEIPKSKEEWLSETIEAVRE